MSLFETAVRSKLRFDSPKGLLTVEDLWDLPLTTASPSRPSLDDMARNLYKQLKEFSDDTLSFVKPSTVSTTAIQTKFDIVKYVIDTKMAERDAAAASAEKSAKKQKLMELIARKQDTALESASIEELQAMLQSI